MEDSEPATPSAEDGAPEKPPVITFSDIQQVTMNDIQSLRLTGLKTNLQTQLATVLGYIKQDTNDIVSQIQARSHSQILKIMNTAMNLVHQLDQVANMRLCKPTSQNPIARGMCRDKREIFNQLEICIQRKNFFEYSGVDMLEGPKVKMNSPFLESASRIAFDIKKSIQSPRSSIKRAQSITSMKSGRSPPTYTAIQANIQSKNSYFFDYDLKQLFKVDGETGSFERINTKIPHNIGPWGGTCRLPDNSIFHLGGRVYPQNEITEYYIIADDYMEIRTMPPNPSLSYHGCVYYSGFVYQFGGVHQMGALSTCARFGLNDGCWDSIRSLPQPTGFNSSVVTGDCILVTGYHLNKLYAYLPLDDEYVKLLDLPGREYKVVFTAFSKAYVLCAGKVYEALLTKLEKWKTAGDIPRGLSSLVSPPTRMGQSIYFMMGKNELWRFNLRNNELLRNRLPIG